MALKVFLTGASSGLGEALARHYAKDGATLGLVARRAEELARVKAAIAPATVETYAADVRDAGAMIAAGRDFVAKHGVPDVVIANAGVSRGTVVEHAEDLAAFRAVLDTNVAGLFNTFHPFVAPMREAKRGTLAGVASVAGFRGLPGSAAYSASKAAAIKVLEALRVELAPAGIAVVTICPGYVATPILEGSKRKGIPLEEFLPQAEFFLHDALDRWILGTEPFTARLNPDAPGYATYDQLMRLDEWMGREA